MDKTLMDFVMTRKCQLFNEEKELRQKGDTHGADLCSHILYELESITQDYEERASQNESNSTDPLLGLDNVISWVVVENGLPDELETVWISNGQGWTTLGCLVYAEGGWHWAETNGVIYQEKGKIVSECEPDDLNVKFWHRLPEPPCV